jgi:hypothetical protein
VADGDVAQADDVVGGGQGRAGRGGADVQRSKVVKGVGQPANVQVAKA